MNKIVKMACVTETPLYQLEFTVKCITRCSRMEEDGCGMAVSIRFLDYPEQTVCEIPAGACARPDCAGAAVTVDRGRTFTFAMFSDGCGPRAVPVTVRLYRLMRRNMSPSREELASGKLNVIPTMAPANSNRCRTAADSCGGVNDDNELTVPMTGCSDGRTVTAVMTVRAQAWCAGSVTATPVEVHEPPTPALSTGCFAGGGSQPSTRSSRYQEQTGQQCKEQCKAAEDDCSRMKQQPPPAAVTKCCSGRQEPTTTPAVVVKCCGGRQNPTTPPPPPAVVVKCCGSRQEPKTPLPPRACRRQCDQCLPSRRTTGNATAGIPALAATTRRQQYSTVGCEFDGHKIDMLVRKKNYETCAVQRHIATEVEEFASKVIAVVRDMHGLVSDSVGATVSDQNDTC